MKQTIPKYSNKINVVEKLEPTFKEKDRKAINKFLLFCGGSAGKTTIDKYHRVIVKICDVFDGDLDKIDLQRLREFLNVLNKSDLMPPTKNELKKVLKRFLKENYEDWSLRFKGFRDPAFKGQKDVNQEKINANTILRPHEVESLIRGIKPLKYKAMFTLMYEVAGRPEEILKLEWKDINLYEGDVTLTSSKTKNIRINPIKESVIHLKRWKEEYPFTDLTTSDYVFPCPYDRTKKQTLPSVGMYLKKLGNKILKRPIFPYLLRHTRATELQKVLKGKVYEKFMDHSLETASRYSHLNKKDVRDAMFKDVYCVKEISEEDQNKVSQALKKLNRGCKDINKTKSLLDKELQRAVELNKVVSIHLKKKGILPA